MARKKGFSVGGLLGVAVLLLVATSMIGQIFFSKKGPRAVEAITACQTFVKQKLKNPDSAEFPYDYLTPTFHVEGGYGWDVTGKVNAQNEFGATVKEQWNCKTKTMDQGKTWNLFELRFF
ncbi:MAG: hypothetical protein HQL52_03770 [Magnetococcales bacterium]|nr:hypothetical protein [Magnetococcales bacterium]